MLSSHLKPETINISHKTYQINSRKQTNKKKKKETWNSKSWSTSFCPKENFLVFYLKVLFENMFFWLRVQLSCLTGMTHCVQSPVLQKKNCFFLWPQKYEHLATVIRSPKQGKELRLKPCRLGFPSPRLLCGLGAMFRLSALQCSHWKEIKTICKIRSSVYKKALANVPKQ